MKIKASLYGMHNVIIIDFMPANSNDIKVVYVDREGKVGSCYLGNVQILDSDYIPTAT